MKICFFIGQLTSGGAEHVTTLLSNHWVKEGHEVVVSPLLDDEIWYQLEPKVRVEPLVVRGNRWAAVPRWVAGIRRICKKERPDVVVSFVARINVLVYLALLGTKIPIVASERNDPRYDGRGLFAQRLVTHIYPRIKRIVFQTNDSQYLFPETVRNNGCVIPNPIDVLTESQYLCESTFIVSVGRLCPQKNHAMLISAFALVHRIEPKLKLEIYGEGPLRDRLQSQIDALGLQDWVVLRGRVSDVASRLRYARAFVLSSDYEGMSNALMEAVASGLPVISTNCLGASDLINDGENGYIVPVGEPKSMAEAIMKIVSDDRLSLEMSKASLKKAQEFDPQVILRSWDSVVLGADEHGSEHDPCDSSSGRMQLL